MKIHFYTQDILKICDDKHLSVDEIFEEISKLHENVWKSSIYRNVEELSNKWMLNKIVWVNKKTLYELSKEDHIHIINSETWEVMDYHIALPKIELPAWFEATSYDIKIIWKYKKT